MDDFEFPSEKSINVLKSRTNEIFNKQRLQTCYVLCGKEIKENNQSFHKSHTVPFFCLENIKDEYKSNYGVINGNYLFSNKMISKEIHRC